MPPNIRQTKIWENIIIRSIVSQGFDKALLNKSDFG